MPDLHDEVKADDDINFVLEDVKKQPDRKEYEVVAEAGLFKNGKQYEKGDLVSLDAITAKNFIRLGEVKEQ